MTLQPMIAPRSQNNTKYTTNRDNDASDEIALRSPRPSWHKTVMMSLSVGNSPLSGTQLANQSHGTVSPAVGVCAAAFRGRRGPLSGMAQDPAE
jgi:hypothetical protein